MVGDASLMHYVVFLMHRGLIPYRDIVDVNLPGSYLAEAAAMHLFGWGSAGWRIYDFVLTLALVAAALSITAREDVFAGFFAGVLFLLIHVQDGMAQLGQRDLLIAVLLACSYAVLYRAQEQPGRGVAILLYGVLMGATVTIKPLFLPLGIALLFISARRARSRGLSSAFYLGLGFLGLILPSLLVAGWLWSHGALPQFVQTLQGLIPFHASLGHKPAAYLLAHCAAPIAPLCVIWILLWACRRTPLDLERVELLVGIAVALLAYFAQGKGYPYHRYPLLALLLMLMGKDLSEALADRRWTKSLAAVGLAYACLLIAPRAAWQVRSFSPATPFETTLAHDLQRQGIPLSGHVQCLDTFGGCINTLYNLRVVQSTGFLYDCYLFEPIRSPAVDAYRASFWAAYLRAKPEVIVLTSQYCFGPDSFRKLDAWPQLRDELSRSYNQASEWHSPQPQHWWARREMPSQYRIYVRKKTESPYEEPR